MAFCASPNQVMMMHPPFPSPQNERKQSQVKQTNIMDYNFEKEEVEKKIYSLLQVDKFIFLFYFHNDNIALNSGSRLHLDFLKTQAQKHRPITTNIYEVLRSTKLNVFSNRAKQIMHLAQAAKKQNVLSSPSHLPIPQVPTDNSDKFSPPSCPYSIAIFNHLDASGDVIPKVHKLSICHVAFLLLVLEVDVKFTWTTRNSGIPNSILEVKVRYLKLMNFPTKSTTLICDRQGKIVFRTDHPCMQALERGMQSRREDDGYIYNTFHIPYKTEQEVQFVPTEDNLNGFDLLMGEDWNNDICLFTILQIVTKDKDFEANKSGSAKKINIGSLSGVTAPCFLVAAQAYVVTSSPWASNKNTPQPATTKAKPTTIPYATPSNNVSPTLHAVPSTFDKHLKLYYK